METLLLARGTRQSSETAAPPGDKAVRPIAPGARLPWPPDNRDLIDLWATGESTDSIAARYGATKNMVVSKARTLRKAGHDLEMRRSPIVRKSRDPVPSEKDRGDGGTSGVSVPAASEPDVSPSVPAPPPELAHLRNFANRPPPAFPDPAAAAAAPVAHLRIGSLRATACCWPLGDPRSKGFRTSDLSVVPRLPYCEEHAGRAYETAKWKRPPQDEAA